jgi:hypothetical protein
MSANLRREMTEIAGLYQSQVEVKCRAHWLIKHMLADQFAHIERDRPVVFNGALAFRLTKQTVRQPLACCHPLPPS